MPYLYGDNSSFPLEIDFIDLLRHVIDTSATILRLEEELETVASKANSAQAETEREAAALQTLHGALLRATLPHLEDAQTPCASRLAGRLRETFRDFIHNTQQEATGGRDALLRDLQTSTVDLRRRIVRATEELLLRHELPETRWEISLRCEKREAPAQAKAIAQCGVEAIFALALDRSIFARPVRVSEIDRDVIVTLPEPGGIFSNRERNYRRRLDRYFLTAITHTPEATVLLLRKHGVRPSPGLELTFAQDAPDSVMVKRLAASGSAVGPDLTLTGADAQRAHKLQKRCLVHLLPLIGGRRGLVSLALDGQNVSEIASAAPLARRLIESVTPIVKEIRTRGRVERELVLKRQLDGGHREEIFLPQTEIIQRLAALGPSHRAMFHVFGVEGAATPPPIPDSSEEVTEEHRPQARAGLLVSKTSRALA